MLPGMPASGERRSFMCNDCSLQIFEKHYVSSNVVLLSSKVVRFVLKRDSFCPEPGPFRLETWKRGPFRPETESVLSYNMVSNLLRQIDR